MRHHEWFLIGRHSFREWPIFLNYKNTEVTGPVFIMQSLFNKEILTIVRLFVLLLHLIKFFRVTPRCHASPRSVYFSSCPQPILKKVVEALRR